jgi:hypothetical protein
VLELPLGFKACVGIVINGLGRCKPDTFFLGISENVAIGTVNIALAKNGVMVRGDQASKGFIAPGLHDVAKRSTFRSRGASLLIAQFHSTMFVIRSLGGYFQYSVISENQFMALILF